MSELESSKSPYGILNNPGGQWPEARQFTRIYGNNPHAQSRFLETLIGLYNVHYEGWSPNSDARVSESEHEIAKRAIAQTIADFSRDFPQWKEDESIHDEGDPRWDFPYTCSALLRRQVEWVISEHADLGDER